MSANSILNRSAYFHVVDGLVPDIMHDVLEGTTHVTMNCLLHYLIQDQKLFSLTLLNERIVSFDFGQVNTCNKPSEISQSSFTSDSLKQSGTRNNLNRTQYTRPDLYYFLLASQMWCLARFLPLLVGDMVPQDDKRWKNFLRLLRIMEYAFAPVITVDKTFYMELLIEEFLTDFVKLYPGRPLTPKMHYLVHLPSWIRR